MSTAKNYLNVPLAIKPERADLLNAERPITASDVADYDTTCGYEVIGNIAVIQVLGVLMQRTGSLVPYYGMTGYDGIKANLLMAMADPFIKGILLRIDSPGGEVAGCFDLCDMIYEARGRKPIWAACDEHAYSAAYAIASSCDFITVPRTGGVGSIGVIALHVDISRMLDQAGITVSIIHYGDRKADGNETQPLSTAARTRLQTDVDAMGELFCATVARNRELKMSTVINTEAATFLGQAGVMAGLADEVGSYEDCFDLFASLLNKPT